MNKLTRYLPILLATLTTAGIAQPASLESAAAAAVTLPLIRTFDATVEAVNEATVASETGGTVEAILFDVDDYVAAGEVVVRFRDSEPRARAAAARASLSEARAALAQAEQEYRRISDIFERKLVARADLERALAQRDTARARVAAAQARLDEVEVQLGNTVVKAPYSGIVKARHVEVGEQAQPGQPLMTGLSLEQLRVTSRIPQGAVPAVRDGAPITVVADGLEPLGVTRMTLFPFADSSTHTVTLRARLPDGTSGYYPGMHVKLAVRVGAQRSLAIPESAVVTRSELTAVYVVGDGGRLTLRQVRLGRRHEGLRVVDAGLAAGERVALDPDAAGAVLKAQLGGGR